MDRDDAFIKIYDSEDIQYHGGDKEEAPAPHGDAHSHSHGDAKKDDGKDEQTRHYEASMKKLKIVSFVSIFFITAQMIGGYLANSIAIYTDSAHLASDMIGFAISMFALKMAMRPSSRELTFGWHRAEILGTLISIVFLLTLTIWLVFEAADRVVAPQEVKGMEMAITAVMGLGFNLIQMRILHEGEGGYSLGGAHSHSHGDDEHGHGHGGGGGDSLAVKAAFLHALGDMIMSIGVCIAASIIYVGETYLGIDPAKLFICDPICTFVFSAIVCATVIPVVKQCTNILMEGAPLEFDTDALILDMKACAKHGDDIRIEDFHLWSISLGKIALSAHIYTNNPQQVLKDVIAMAQDKYNIDHCTIQVEEDNSSGEHKFESAAATNKKFVFKV